jgi:hypothetical protein
MVTNDQFHVPVDLPQGKNPLLAQWIGGASDPTAGLELAAKKKFRHARDQTLILR